MDIGTLKRGERELIGQCVLFQGGDDRFIDRALSDERCRLIELRKGDVVSGVYDYRRCLGLALSGSIAVTKPTSSRFVMHTLERGSLFGAADLYDDACENDVAAPVTVLTAVSPVCRIVFFPRALIEALMREEHRVALNYIRFLTGRVRFLNEKIQGLVSETAEDALRQYLALNAQTVGGESEVCLPGSISALAEQLNLGRASLYRVFDALERSGLIKKEGRKIRILDHGGLSNTEQTRAKTHQDQISTAL